MKVCNDIKRRIDEAAQPDQLGLEITQHTALCAACQKFADQRVALRNLVTARARVNAPVNFDARLNARLAELRARKSFAWFSPTVYLRFGAATAAIVVAICAAQYSNLFATEQSSVAIIPQAVQPIPSNFMPPLIATPPPPVISEHIDSRVTITSSHVIPVTNGSPERKLRRYAPASLPLVASHVAIPDESSPIILRRLNVEREMQMRIVTVGAQSWLYENAGGQPQPEHTRPRSF